MVQQAARTPIETDAADVREWMRARREANSYEVTVVGLDELVGWRFEPGTGNLVHHTGKFFSVRGIDVRTDHREVDTWTQPIILQPEIGILGILVAHFDGVPHCLMQAKMEPGNINVLQLSPTVQATRSNYTRVHQGNPVPYLEHFVAPRAGRVVFDALQSEQGSWFLDKRNRNIIVEVDDAAAVEVLDDFRWISVPLLRALLLERNLVNMDSRTVLSGLPALTNPNSDKGTPRHTTEELLSWFTEAKSRYTLDREVIALDAVRGWSRSTERISHERDRFFDVIGVRVRASSREVAQWSQPMFAPRGQGVIAFVCRWFDGTPHVLSQARTEPGTGDVVEMSSTVNAAPDNYGDGAVRPPYLDYVLAAPAERVLLDVVHSEEGGRFYHAENRYLVVEADADFPDEVPEDFAWMTVPQLAGFVRYGNHVNVGARSLLTCLSGMAQR
ncbi:NDP-hexose 2,3-dehydratase family protein [Actinokineospora sp. G85]|uniref:NDP-hexose 2,3-dehydratase family protein n=1 Tax=Actinokineospora sp. G85 TaxID=3406626 RepID=UPI003C78BE66